MGRRRGGKRKLLENIRLWRYVCCGLKREWSPDEIVKRLQMDYGQPIMTHRILHKLCS
jgi:IS30 family transposase